MFRNDGAAIDIRKSGGCKKNQWQKVGIIIIKYKDK
jgi:hypothetical protein